MAETFGPGGASDASFEERGYFNLTPGATVRPTDTVGQQAIGALATPLNHLIAVQIDPTWWAINSPKGLWSNPLGNRISPAFLDIEGGITETAAVKYSDIDVLGRVESYKTYTGTENRQVQLTFQFRAQGLGNKDLAQTLKEEVEWPAKWFDECKYAKTYNGVAVPPPPVILMLGELLTMRCLVDCSIRWVGSVDPSTGSYYGADVDVTFTAVTEVVGNYRGDGPSRWAPAQPNAQALPRVSTRARSSG